MALKIHCHLIGVKREATKMADFQAKEVSKQLDPSNIGTLQLMVLVVLLHFPPMRSETHTI